jgi:hypothetical protein
VLITPALIGAVAVGFLLLRPGGDETPPLPRTTIELALARFAAERFGVAYVGTCPQEFPADGEVPRGVCSGRLSGADGRALYRVGHPFSEWGRRGDARKRCIGVLGRGEVRGVSTSRWLIPHAGNQASRTGNRYRSVTMFSTRLASLNRSAT